MSRLFRKLKFHKGKLITLVGIVVSAFGSFLEMRSDLRDAKEEARAEFRENYKELVMEEVRNVVKS